MNAMMSCARPYKALVLLGLCAALAAPSFAGRRNAPGVSADGALQWARRSIDGNGSIAQVDQPTLDGGPSYRFVVPDDGVSYRAELAAAAMPWGHYRYQFAVFVPQDWRPNHRGAVARLQARQWQGHQSAHFAGDRGRSLAADGQPAGVTGSGGEKRVFSAAAADRGVTPL